MVALSPFLSLISSCIVHTFIVAKWMMLVCLAFNLLVLVPFLLLESWFIVPDIVVDSCCIQWDVFDLSLLTCWKMYLFLIGTKDNATWNFNFWYHSYAFVDFFMITGGLLVFCFMQGQGRQKKLGAHSCCAPAMPLK